MGAGFTNSVFGGVQAKSLQRFYYSLASSDLGSALAEKTITLATPVEDYTKCIVLVKGTFPYMVSLTTGYITYGYQKVEAEAYARMTSNNTIKLKVSWTEPVLDGGNTNYSTGMISGYIETTFAIEIIELKGLKSITYQEIINTNRGSFMYPGSAPASVTPEKCIVIYQGSFMIGCGGSSTYMEYKRLVGFVNPDKTLNYVYSGAISGYGGSSFNANHRLGVYILETW